MIKMNKLIYLDNAATTKTAQEAVDAMLPYFKEYYGNARALVHRHRRSTLQQVAPNLTTGH